MSQKKTRGRPSKVDQLPAEVQDTLHKLLRDGRHTQQDILDHINKLLPQEDQLSRSGLNRYATRMETVGAKLRETREVANVWMARFGDEPTSDVLQLVVEMCQGALFKYALKASEGDDESLFDPDAMKDVTLSIQRLAKAAEMNAKREKEIRKAFAEKAADEADQVAKEAGLSAEAVQTIKNRILGIV
jgi:hypothetical protein